MERARELKQYNDLFSKNNLSIMKNKMKDAEHEPGLLK